MNRRRAVRLLNVVLINTIVRSQHEIFDADELADTVDRAWDKNMNAKAKLGWGANTRGLARNGRTWRAR